MVPSSGVESTSKDGRAGYTKRLRVYRDRLLQLDWRNRSILLKKAYKSCTFDLGALGAITPDTIGEVLARAIKRKGRVRLVRDADRGKVATEFRATLTQVSRWTRLLYEESGVQDTYLGFPFLAGHADPERYVRAPLVLFPVQLEHLRRERVPGWYVTFTEDNPPVLNRALLAALRRVRGISLEDDFQDRLEEVLEMASKERIDRAGAFLQFLAQALVEGGFPLKARKSEVVEVPPLTPLSSEDLEWMPATPLHLEPLAVLGSFPQGSTAIYQDYEVLIQRVEAGEVDQGVVADLIEAPDRPTGAGSTGRVPDLDRLPDRQLNFALPTDGSQEAVIAEAQEASCVLVRGPPGTGKSQVIVNLITNGLAKGERVLVVCQKRAALDIVHQRLGRVGLADYAVLLHDARADRRDVYGRLAKRLQAPTSGEDIRLAREFTATTEAIDQTIGELNTAVNPLWREYVGGVRLQELYAAAGPGLRPRRDLHLQLGDLTYPKLGALLEKMHEIEAGYRRFDAAGAPWSGRRPFVGLAGSSREEIDDALAAVEEAAVPEALCLPSAVRHQRLLAHLYRYEAGAGRRTRYLSPRWWGSRWVVGQSLRRHSQDPRIGSVADLERSLVAGQRLAVTVEGLGTWLQPLALGQLQACLTKPPELLARVAWMRRALADFDAMQEYDGSLDSLGPPELALLRSCAETLAKGPEPWGPLLKQEVIAHWIAAIERRHPQLTGDPFPRYVSLSRRLGELLEKRRALFVRKLALDLDDRARGSSPGLRGASPRDQEPALNRLVYELTKKKRIKPVRRLMEEYGPQFMRVAPCWLVSPEAASEVFPLQRGLFDLVVFDESSQLAVERSLPAVYRGKRVLIAGDEKQLRPFDLFQLREDEGEVEAQDEVTEAESLLVLAMRTFTPRYLNWHYRSKYQELIDFSNHAFYDGNLQIAANVQRVLDEPPIEFVRCKGTWEDRRNPLEATKVVDLVARLLERNEESETELSFGIVTFNDPQRDQILDAIDARRGRDPEFDVLYSKADAPERPLDDRPFVKNLENVQGDERDVILFSVGYGPDAEGRLRVQFGSLNLEGGENRLNVAITRARQRIVMVASFDPEFLPAEETKNSGPKRLKEYLLYAQAVSGKQREEVAALLSRLNKSLAEDHNKVPLSLEHSLESQVCDALRALGYEVDTQVGFSGYRVDLAVVHPQDPRQYVLGIECDGAMFHSARSCRERDVTRRRYLEERGWTMERIWSRNWWRNRQTELDRIHHRIQGLAAQPISPPK